MNRMVLMIFSFSFIFSSLHSISNSYQISDLMKIQTPSGLNLREGPDVKSKKILLIQNGEIVSILNNENQIPFEFEGTKGFWVSINYNGYTGYTIWTVFW